MVTKKTTKFDFEASLKKLESIVTLIEKGGLNLEESLKFFAEGVELTKGCQQALKSAEQKVKILTGDGLTEFKLNFESEIEDGDKDR